jgi:hypothetical protein
MSPTTCFQEILPRPRLPTPMVSYALRKDISLEEGHGKRTKNGGYYASTQTILEEIGQLPN